MTVANPMDDHRWWLPIHTTAFAQAYAGHCLGLRIDRRTDAWETSFTIRRDACPPEHFLARSVSAKATFVDETAEARAMARWEELLAAERLGGLPVTVRAVGESGSDFVSRHVAAYDAWEADRANDR